MKLEKLENPEKYTGLYVVDFGDYTSSGFTGQEVEMLLESEKYASIKVYKIHNAYPDGTLELRGVPNEIFNLEGGMFFYSDNEFTANADYKRLLQIMAASQVPARAKVHLSRLQEALYAVALIYPAEADDDFARLLLDKDYKTTGQVCGGVEKVSQYYDADPQVLQRQQLISSRQSKDLRELYSTLKYAVQR